MMASTTSEDGGEKTVISVTSASAAVRVIIDGIRNKCERNCGGWG